MFTHFKLFSVITEKVEKNRMFNVYISRRYSKFYIHLLFIMLILVDVRLSAQVIKQYQINTSDVRDPKNILINPSLAQVSTYGFGTIEDFQVNEENSEATFCQSYPDIASFPDGSFVVVWEDYRNGDRDIYLQFYDLYGNEIGNNIIVNDDASGADQKEPCISTSSNGTVVVVWIDGREDIIGDIYFQQYDKFGNVIGENKRVNQDEFEHFHYCPDVSSASDGTFVVVWTDNRDSDFNLYFQLYDQSGNPRSNNMKVIDDDYVGYLSNPQVAMNSCGTFLILWEDQRTEENTIFFQRHDNTGKSLGVKQTIDIPSYNSNSGQLSLSGSFDASFVFSWTDERNGNSDIYFQRFDSLGKKIGENVMANDDGEAIFQCNSKICHRADGSFIIFWEDHRFDIPEVYFQQYNKLGFPIGSNRELHTDGYYASLPFCVTLASDTSSLFCWAGNQNGNQEIFFQKFGSNGFQYLSRKKVNDDDRGASQYNPKISSSFGSFVIIWYDERKEYSGFFLQLYDEFGNPINENIMGEDYRYLSVKKSPSISSLPDGSFIVVFESGNIYFQRYNNLGIPFESYGRVNDKEFQERQLHSFSISTAFDSSFAVVWNDEQNEYSDVYIQFFDKAGEKNGNNLKISERHGETKKHRPVISHDIDGSSVSVWEEYKLNDNFFDVNIYLQRIDSFNNLLGENIKINDNLLHFTETKPDVTFLLDGSFIVAWSENFDIFFQIFDSSANPIGRNQKVFDESDANSDRKNPSVASNSDGLFVIVWEDYRNGINNSDIYAQKYLPDGTPLGTNFRVNDDATLKHQLVPDVTINNQNEMIFVWQDSRISANGYDIFAKVMDFEIEENVVSKQTPSIFPNPFTPNNDGYNDYVEFKYPAMYTQSPTIQIFNLNGRKITELKDFNSPVYRWYGRDENGQDLEAGVYLYILKADGKRISSGTITLIR